MAVCLPRPSAPGPHALPDLLALLGANLGANVQVLGDPAEVLVTGATHDSRAVQRGDLYAALP
ncbi:MAG TPA: hypothetical protein VNE21_06010, partial [Mycobacteriales bacterium]|nr:hypothetical protein [Mycobacteriales bacterium]